LPFRSPMSGRNSATIHIPTQSMRTISENLLSQTLVIFRSYS
jgi:hypothetical protein